MGGKVLSVSNCRVKVCGFTAQCVLAGNWEQRARERIALKRLRILGALVCSGAIALALGLSACEAERRLAPASSAEFGKRLPLQDQMVLREYLYARQFDLLERTLKEYLAAYYADTRYEIPLADAFYAFQMQSTEPAALLDEWVERFPKSYAARLARGVYFSRMGWEQRGTQSARETSAENFRGMQHYFALARGDLEASLAMSPRPVLSYQYLINIANTGHSYAEAAFWLDNALKLDPYAARVRTAYLYGLRPEWGGSLEEMEEFVAVTRRYPDHPKLDFIVRLLEAGVLERRCRSAQEDHHYERALEYCTQALALDKSVDNLTQHAYVLSYLQRYEEALAHITQALELSPEDTWALQQQTWLHKRLGIMDGGPQHRKP